MWVYFRHGSGRLVRVPLTNGKVNVDKVKKWFGASDISFLVSGIECFLEAEEGSVFSSDSFEENSTVDILCQTVSQSGRSRDISDSDVQIKRKLEEMGVHLSHMDSELKRIKSAPSQTDYWAIGKEFQGREDWVESHSILETFEIDVTDQVKSLLQKIVIGFKRKKKESEKDAAKRYEEELSGYSFKDLRLAEAEAQQRNAEMESRFKKYGVPKGEGVVQLAHGRVCRLLQAAAICYRAEDTHRRGVANAAVRPDLAYFDGLSPGRDFSVMVIPAELKENLELADALAGAIGELISRLRDILDAQHLRHFVYGYIADGETIMIIRLSRSSTGTEHVSRTGWLKLDFSPTSPGLHMLLKLLYSHGARHGYMPPPLIPAFTTGDGRTVKDVKLLASRLPRDGSPNSRGVVVYQGKMEGQEVVVKIGPHLGEEVRAMLELPQDIGLVPLLAYGHQEKFLEGRDYLITPCFTTLSLDLRTKVLLDVISQIGKTVNELGKAGVFHGDISYGNIVYAWNPLQAYLIDLGSASTHRDRSCGTLLFMSYGVLVGHKRTVSMELESLLYVLIYIAVEGRVHWKNCKSPADNAARKAECLLLEKRFAELVSGRCEDDGLRIVISKLRSLFWQPQYREDVTYKEFADCLNSKC